MRVEQIDKIINEVSSEVLGKTIVRNENLNYIDIGKEIFDIDAVDNYVRKLIDHIGRMVFVDRVYRGNAPSVLRDGWEFGSVLEKVAIELPDANENESWDLVDGASYDPNIFTAPKVYTKFFNKRVTFEIPMSFTVKQVKESFSNATQLNAFYSMIYNAIENSMTLKLEGLIMRTIDNMIGETIYSEFSDGEYSESGVKAVNILKLYNDEHSDATLTSAEAIRSPEFLRYASFIMNMYVKRLSSFSTLFNVGGRERFTPRDRLSVILLSEFESGASVYLYDGQGQFKDENLRLPKAEVVPFWQGSGLDFKFDSTSKIDIRTASGNDIAIDGILGVMFDYDALGVTNEDRRVTTQWNGKGEFTNNWYKYDAGYFNDLNENFVVFFIHD